MHCFDASDEDSNTDMVALVKDYEAMAGTIFGDVPSLEAVLASVEALDSIVNNASPAALPVQGEG